MPEGVLASAFGDLVKGHFKSVHLVNMFFQSGTTFPDGSQCHCRVVCKGRCLQVFQQSHEF